MVQLFLRGQPLGSVEAILFDKDGTLSLSEPGLLALSRARLQACLEHVPEAHRSQFQDLLERAYGLVGDQLNPAGTTAVASRTHNLISTATAFCQVGLGWPEALDHSEAVFAAIDREQLQTDGDRPGGAPLAPLSEGVAPLLLELHRSGVQLAVISNDDSEGIQRFLGGHGLAELFQEIWSADMRPAKPDPAAVHGLCSRLGVSPSACALIGDACSDLRMAERAGVGLALGYSAGWSSRPPLPEHMPRLDHWHELQVAGSSGMHPSPEPGDKLGQPEVGASLDEPLRLHI
ncbi:HAD family hydrolase [Synechococcus sp. Cruz-9H2]|uniref:HAD family hydrolase n=1 Tax=unclassified Synechococcus TaxID=2626047 RepID=UPI0020CB70DC|nr:MULTISPECIES: HAD family hydrolase [unclassified Synechococcus]MCP9820933.1 HAD family hydrolase [Synechococcus sp. Cruz-9H2]MCP9845168.1 HAD family hydrolase [Synechococcus sp. Edmonson 11F2]MCP9857349.1 HAD family hydrolase [Synechococcus sp. Cruz-9C9]MCP9864594.1 HAD family hydrolase [Synechococcus sp. Cruz-7E5]MCP9871864.1 HAD family hydrolase [Synechococcus sp. Cruz-7B9]